MTVSQIINAAVGYLQQPRSEFQVGGVDLALTALNNARKQVERQHDWMMQQKLVRWTVVPSTGVNWTSGVLDSDGVTSVSVKAIDQIYLKDLAGSSYVYFPLYLNQKRMIAMKLKEKTYRFNNDLARYPTDWQGYSNATGQLQGMVQGGTLYLHPEQSINKTVCGDCHVWMDDYAANSVVVTASSTAGTGVTLSATAPANLVVGSTLLGQRVTVVAGTSITLAGNAEVTIATPTVKYYTNDPTIYSGAAIREEYSDWLTNHGAEYLQWATVIELNHLTTTFVPRQEGFLSAPEKLRDMAYGTLVQWDDFMIEQGREPLAIY